MKINSLIAGVVGIIICAVMVAGALLPAVSSVTDDEKTVFNNTLSNRYSLYYDGIEDITADLTVDRTSRTISGTINGATYAHTVPNSTTSIIMAKGLSLVMMSSGESWNYDLIYNGSLDVIKTLEDAVSVTINDGVITVKDTTNTYTQVISEWLFISDANGNYEFVGNSVGNVYVGGTDDLFFVMKAPVVDGIVSGPLNNVTSSTGSVVTVTAPLELINGFTDVYSIDLSTVKITGATGEYTPATFLVPRSVDGHTEQNKIIIALFDVLPIVAVAGLVMAGIYVFISRK